MGIGYSLNYLWCGVVAVVAYAYTIIIICRVLAFRRMKRVT